jgi:hypothetical protein
MPSPAGRGAQVRLDGTAQAAARGGLGLPLLETSEAKRALELTGVSSDGATRDGSTRNGTAAEDEVLAPGGIFVGGGGTISFGTTAGTAAQGNDPRIVGALPAAVAAQTYATPAAVQAAVQAVVGAAPAALDTLAELAKAINDDPNAITAVNTALAAQLARIATLEGLVATLQAAAAVNVAALTFQNGTGLTFQDGQPVVYQ